MQARALSLMEKRAHEMNPAEVLHLMPGNWPLAVVEKSLSSMIGTLQHRVRSQMVYSFI